MKIQVGPNTIEMVLVETNAPPDYDYGYCIVAYDSGTYGKADCGRLVWMPEESFDYQTGRYASGLYTASRVESESLLTYYAERLWDALFHKDLPIAQV